MRTACPSADGTRSVGHAISALEESSSYRGGKGKGKGKGKGAGGRGSGGRGRSAAGRGKGAIAVYLEDDQAWGLDGAFVASVTTDAHLSTAWSTRTSRRTRRC